MSVGIEDTAHAAIVAAIEADAVVVAKATSGVHLDEPSSSLAPPYMVVEMLTGEDAHTFADRAFVECLFEVRAVVDHRTGGVPARVVQLAEAARGVMEGTITGTGITISGGRRVQRIARREVLDGGVVRHHRGGVFYAMVQASA